MISPHLFNGIKQFFIILVGYLILVVIVVINGRVLGEFVIEFVAN